MKWKSEKISNHNRIEAFRILRLNGTFWLLCFMQSKSHQMLRFLHKSNMLEWTSLIEAQFCEKKRPRVTMVNKTQYKRISECAACLLSLAHKVVSPSVSIKRQSVLPLKNKSTFKHMQMQIGGTLQPKFPFSFAYRWNAECTQWLQYIWSYFRLSIWAARTGMQWIRVFFAIESKNQLIWNILKFI